MRTQLRRLTVLLMVLWPLVALMTRIIAVQFSRLDPDPPRLAPITWIVATWLIWSILTPYIVHLARRHPPAGAHRRRNILVMVQTLVVFAVLHFVAFALVRYITDGVRIPILLRAFPGSLRFSTLGCGVIAAAVWVLQLQRRTRLAALRRSRLERELAASRVDSVVVALDAPWIFRTLDDAEERLAGDRGGAIQRVFALSQHLREKLRHRLNSGSFAAIETEATVPPPRRMAWVAAGLFCAFSAYTTLLFFIRDRIIGQPTDGRSELARLFAFAVAMLFWPIVAWTSRRTSGMARNWRRVTVIGTAVVAHGLFVELVMLSLRATGLSSFPGEHFSSVVLLSFLGAYLVQSEELGRIELAERLRTQEMARMVSDARLRSLRTQIAPHFLFNTLNSILSLIAHDPEAARRMLRRLRRILELTFVCDTRQEVALREELDLTVSYIEIERIRFRDALDVAIDIDASLLNESVPAFLLQPLVENAVRHGALASLNRGSIRLLAQRREAMMELAVENDSELVDPAGWREGIGLTNIRARLEHLYAANHSLDVEMARDGRVSVRIRLPLAV